MAEVSGRFPADSDTGRYDAWARFIQLHAPQPDEERQRGCDEAPSPTDEAPAAAVNNWSVTLYLDSPTPTVSSSSTNYPLTLTTASCCLSTELE